jgi:Uracil-DNA glycosylase
MRVSDKQLAYLDAMGIQVWQERVQHEEPAVKASTETIEAHSLAELYQLASTCQRCHAGNLRKHVVFGEGPEQAEWLIVVIS